jgi:hypothetical protein
VNDKPENDLKKHDDNHYCEKSAHNILHKAVNLLEKVFKKRHDNLLAGRTPPPRKYLRRADRPPFAETAAKLFLITA